MTGTAKIIGILIILALASTVVGAIYRAAYNEAEQAVERQNDKAGDTADIATYDYGECRRAGRVWNYVTDKCGGSQAGRGR